MTELRIDQAILVRNYDLDGEGTVQAAIWQPRETETGMGFDCPHRIIGIGNEKTRFGRGIDSIQAVMLGLNMLASSLYDSPEYKAGRLTYLGTRDLDLPETSGYRLGEDSHEKADILAHEHSSVILMPSERFPRIAFDGHFLKQIIDSAEAVSRNDTDSQQRAQRLVGSLDLIRKWYEEVSRRAGFTPPYVGG